MIRLVFSGGQISKLSEAERVEATKQLDKMDEELQSKLVQEIDAYLQWSTHSTDNGMFNQCAKNLLPFPFVICNR